MSRSLRDLEYEAFVLDRDATQVEMYLRDLYSSTFPEQSILSEDLEGYIGEFEELRDPAFGEMWANFSRVLTRMLNFFRMVRPNAEEVLGYETIELLDEILEQNDDRDWHTSKMRKVFGADYNVPYPTIHTNFTDYIMNTAREYEEHENQFGPLDPKIWEHLGGTGMESIYKLFNDAKQACESIGYDLRNTRQERCALQRAFLLGLHHRLGSRSRVRELSVDALELVTDALDTLDS